MFSPWPRRHAPETRGRNSRGGAGRRRAAVKGRHDMADASVISSGAGAKRGAFAAIDPGVRIGHVHLKVSDIEHALGFYCGVLGFELMQRYGREAAFVS